MARNDGANEFSLFRNLVSDEEREAVSRRVQNVGTGNFEGIADQARAVLAALLGGKLPPAIAQEARGLLEVQMMAVAAAQHRDNPAPTSTPPSVTLNLLNALEAAPPALEAKYTDSSSVPAIPPTPVVAKIDTPRVVIEDIEDVEDLT